MLETEETTVCGRTRAGQLWVTVAQLNEGGLGPRSSHNFEHAGEDEYSWESTLRTDTGGDQNKEVVSPIQVAMFVHVGRRGFGRLSFSSASQHGAFSSDRTMATRAAHHVSRCAV